MLSSRKNVLHKIFCKKSFSSRLSVFSLTKLITKLAKKQLTRVLMKNSHFSSN